MPRKKIAEIEAEQRQVLEDTIQAYPLAVLDWIERAQKVNFELFVKNRWFILRDRDDTLGQNLSYEMTHVYTNEGQAGLNDLVWAVEYKEQQIAEWERKENLRRSALGKLTTEEREILGLYPR